MPASRYFVYLMLASLLWGGNWPAVRLALDEIGPWTLRTIGLALGAISLMLIVAARGQPLTVRASQWLPLAISGLFSIAAFNVLLAFAQLSASTSRAAVITFTMPVWTVLLARLFLREPFDRRKLLGLALGISGLAVLAWPLAMAGAFTIGLLYALLAGIAWAVGTVISKRFPVAAPPMSIAAWQLAVGAGGAAAGMLLFEGVALPETFKTVTVAAVAYHVLLAQALAYALWFACLAAVPAGVASLGILTVPAIGVVGAMAVLGERPSPTDFAGLALVIAAAVAVLTPGPGPARASGAN